MKEYSILPFPGIGSGRRGNSMLVFGLGSSLKYQLINNCPVPVLLNEVVVEDTHKVKDFLVGILIEVLLYQTIDCILILHAVGRVFRE